eukprot:7395394-Alexandrium_andersonii.AAC.1
MSASLVGSEMCIRDRALQNSPSSPELSSTLWNPPALSELPRALQNSPEPVSYTHLTLPTICSV